MNDKLADLVKEKCDAEKMKVSKYIQSLIEIDLSDAPEFPTAQDPQSLEKLTEIFKPTYQEMINAWWKTMLDEAAKKQEPNFIVGNPVVSQPAVIENLIKGLYNTMDPNPKIFGSDWAVITKSQLNQILKNGKLS